MLVLALHPKLAATLRDEVPDGVDVIAVDSPVAGSQAIDYACRVAGEKGCDELFLLYGDLYLKHLALRCQSPRLSVSVLLFRFETFLLGDFLRLRWSMRKIATQAVKHLFVLRLLRRSFVRRVLFIEPWSACFYESYGRGKVALVPEPVSFDQPAPAASPRTGASFTIVVSGLLDVRKRVVELCGALALCGRPGVPITLRVIGPVLENYSTVLHDAIERARRHGVRIELENRSFGENEIPAILGNSDLIWLGYGYEHVGMSSIFAWAAALQKPVLTVRGGLVGFAVEKFHLGYVTRSWAACEIAAVIDHAIDDHNTEVKRDWDGFSALFKGFSPEKFLEDWFQPTPEAGSSL